MVLYNNQHKTVVTLTNEMSKMKTPQITKARKIVTDELNALCDKHGIEKMFVVDVVQGSESDWVGVEVRTDGDIYDLFYEAMGGDEVLDRQFAISKKVDVALGDKEGEHYFEKYGGGVIYIF